MWMKSWPTIQVLLGHCRFTTAVVNAAPRLRYFSCVSSGFAIVLGSMILLLGQFMEALDLGRHPVWWKKVSTSAIVYRCREISSHRLHTGPRRIARWIIGMTRIGVPHLLRLVARRSDLGDCLTSLFHVFRSRQGLSRSRKARQEDVEEEEEEVLQVAARTSSPLTPAGVT
mmetsp:Transcript_54177/g.155679  ORF Transcript_54177/g.155679 Transcript_54177/m.155679 type:complete len:171 (+) Transcript_54177:4454-4966(+)